MITGAVAARSLAVPVAIALLGFGALAAGRVPFRHAIVRLRATLLVVGGAIALRAFTSHAHALLDGATVAARVLASAVWASWFVGAYSPSEIDAALRALGAPRAMVALLALTRRFGAQLVATMRSAWSATALRGGFRTVRNTAASVGAIAGVVTVRALDRSFRAKLALDLRGGDGALFLGREAFSWTSWLAITTVVGALAIVDRAWSLR